ncbi:non-lysosomal glucosylceramidase-like isoform X2 [Eurytemora carolleeae]|uniref:non-lysosomal glucosylceramidase-like isoform X2 n=1 Tax=Eurytemora carolleeae TaxID=1294199 RepID=UPI000C76BA62|nr:non-lysosomal glucosylceramidase-like isoform X2 [Eurytemora carolleeae]|eukprot:XP_023331930.1 non-lysosomal glucosylceramidase-like isoform X2 [Eurytemora affinis]
MFPLHAQYLQNISMQFFIFILFVFIREMNNVYTSDEEEEEEERENLIQAKETREQTEKVEEEERNISRFPKYGWKVKLDHEFPEERDQNLRPSFGQIFPELAPLGLRYLFWWLGKLKAGRLPVIDQFRPRHSKRMYGVPCGGLGSGTVGRGFRGEFCRFNMIPGMYEYNTVPSDQFILSIHSDTGGCIYQSVLGGRGASVPGAPSSWKWAGNPEDSLYCGLYPRSWTVYNILQVGVRVLCRQISPVIPGDYNTSCLPASAFIFTVENNSDVNLQVSITLSFKNGTGGKADKEGGVRTQPFQQENSSGVSIHGKIRGEVMVYSIGARKDDKRSVSWCSGFDPKGTGEKVWRGLEQNNKLESEPEATQPTSPGQEVAVAVSSRMLVEKRSCGTLDLALAWDNPKIKFRDGNKVYRRRYTRRFGIDGQAGPKLVSHALRSWEDWDRWIEEWQEPVLSDSELPDWFKSAIFNELYFLSDGGGVWLEVEEGENLSSLDPRLEYGRWGYLESHEYRMYNTYDVHFYASWALIDLFPGLELSLQLDFLDSVVREDKDPQKELYGGKITPRKIKDSVPHDLGDPEEEPWLKVNSYNIHDVSEWRDLNLKLVIQVWRDIKLLPEKESAYLLEQALPVCAALMEVAQSWDKDGDGLIENSGWPDQTFDSWVMLGASAYCGGLYLASLAAMADMSDRAGLEHQWREKLSAGELSFEEKLWGGDCFKFDTSPRGENVIMADQLAGYWYCKITDPTQGILDPEKVLTSLKTIFSNNVMKFCEGTQGAVNGMLRTGGVDRSTVQSEEVWTGVTYALASLMIAEGLVTQGFKTAEGIYRTVYETIGLGYETPEALYEKKHYRAIGYMRPLSIWSMYIAWRNRKKSQKKNITI